MGDAVSEAVLIQKDSDPKASQEEMGLVKKNLALSSEKIDTSVQEPRDNPKSEGISFCVFQDESQLKVLMSLIDKELSEPYSIYTYRYFVYNWPDLCFFALDGDRYVGVIVCKLEATREGLLQGYIAMLAVDVEYRKRGIGKALSEMAIEAMAMKDAAMIVLETELSNKPALALYQSLGFIRERRFLRYYMNGVDAFHLKLMLHDHGALSLNED
ncbi:N-alpha-acetyltransferase 30 [Drosophila yakuba]|uniref:N-acetyltransferase domain-containing protein n=1 Tax=Drosophila yakuba TaxID=7245 RepID=B4PD91_DROYA|nr:N-alpha-acetyltransferase 30 [Drosophila yakuba]EDW92839.1 uncharacterized protein Dyak_GE20959 [Drosophila yakuba]